jgi:parallel beta-helix repeat protein
VARRIIWLAALIAIAGGAGFPVKASAFTKCADHNTPLPYTISKCGCVVTLPGEYTVTADLNFTQGLTEDGSCIRIDSDGATIAFSKAVNITGPGTGKLGTAAIRIGRPGAVDSILGDNGNPTISGWDSGIDIAGRYGFAQGFTVTGNRIGVFVRGNNAIVRNYTAQDNIIAGTILSSDHAEISSAVISGNQMQGLGVSCERGRSTCDQNRVIDSTFSDNLGAGILLSNDAHENLVSGNTASGNATFDMFDLNNDCDSNQWLNNTFNTSMPSGCIH